MFGVRSVNLTPWSDTRVVYEILEPNCITQELINRSNVVYNNNHSNDISDMIGRCVNGKGTLSLVLRENYMESSCDYPNTTVANDTLEHIRLGNVYGMSFAFDDRNANGEENVTYERTNETVDGKEVWLRHVWLITKLFDVANVTHPAYEQTSVATREMSEAIDKAIEEQLKRECGGKNEEDDKRDCGDDDKRGCGDGKDDQKRDDDPDDKDDIKDDDPGEKDDKDDADEQAKRAAEEEAKKKAEQEEAAKREAEAKAKAEQEARELEEQEQRFREQQAMRLRYQARRINDEILESLNY